MVAERAAGYAFVRRNLSCRHTPESLSDNRPVRGRTGCVAGVRRDAAPGTCALRLAEARGTERKLCAVARGKLAYWDCFCFARVQSPALTSRLLSLLLSRRRKR